MYRTSFFMNRAHLNQLGMLAEARGLKTSQLLRVAIVEFLHREHRKQTLPVIVRGKTRRAAVME